MAFLVVEEISHKDCIALPNGTQGVGHSYFLQETSIGGTVPGQRLATFFSKTSGFQPHAQAAGTILVGAWADFRPISSGT